jgi:DNA-binding NarL/FixJ family response regulator
MPIKCLLACADEMLLGSIVEDLLTQDNNMELCEIIGMSQPEVIKAIERKNPDVVVFCYQTHDTVPSNFMRILQDYPELLIITVTSDDNHMHIYGKQKVLMTQSEDLISVIQSH